MPHYERFVAAFPTPGRLRGGAAGGGGAPVVGSRVQPPGAQPAPGGRHGRRRPRRRRAPRGRGAARAARRRSLHGARRPRRSPSARTSPRSTPTPCGSWPAAWRARRSAPRRRPARRPARARRPVVGVQPDHVRPRGDRVHGVAARLRGAARCAASAPGAVTGPARADPWRSSPTARPQSTFAGSDRQGRGRLLDALRRGGVAGGDAGGRLRVARGPRPGPSGSRRRWWTRGSPRWSGGSDPVLRLRWGARRGGPP